MKKAAALLLVVAILAAMLCVPASAAGLKLNSGVIRFNIYKANPENIVKDGKIGDGEYHKLDTSTNPDDTRLYVIFGAGSTAYDDAMAMLETMEYYFSWDEEHGLNFAVRYAPRDVVQLLDVKKTGAYPEDGFMNNCALGISFSDRYISNDEADILYYSIAKRTDDGRYLQGWYNQLGYNQDYTCEAEKDFIIEYTDDGYVTYEWSIPFEYFISGEADAGSTIHLNIFAMAGDAKDVNYTDCYGVSLGDRCYLRITTSETRAALGLLSDTSVEDAPSRGSDVTLSSFFNDTDDDAWYAPYVLEAYYDGLMQGKGNKTFGPNDSLTRAELVTLLYRLQNSPSVRYDRWYDDVPEGEWYTNAIVWAARCGIVSGFPDRTFRPNEKITREQIATILMQYAQYSGEKVYGAINKLDSFPDSGEISDYAHKPMVWANYVGLITGKAEPNGTTVIAPRGNTTRAEVATILFRYMEEFGN